MSIRHRSKTKSLFGGGRAIGTSTRYPTQVYKGGIAKKIWMDDDPTLGFHFGDLTKPYPPKTAFKAYSHVVPSRLHGKDFRYNRTKYRFKHVPLPPFEGHGGHAVFMADGPLINQFYENLSPVKPRLDLPLFLWELRELPKLLRDTGQFLNGRVVSNPSDAVLAANFGWGPLLSDIRTMLDITKEMEEHIDRIMGVVLRKRAEMKLRSESHSWPSLAGSRYRMGYGKLDYNLRHYSTTTAWAVGKFNSIEMPPRPHDGLAAATRRAEGLDGRNLAAFMWNAFPWTWLIDYFASVGSFIEAFQGYQKMDIQHVCIMQRCIVKTSVEHDPPQYIVPDDSAGYFSDKVFKPGFAKNAYWRRNVYYHPKPGIYFTPFLTGKMLTNLAALATSSRGRYARTA